MTLDLVVVGLGPGGASTLYSAAKQGLKALGIDKRREIGVPIQCGELLPQPHTYKEILPNAKHLELLTSFPDNIIRNRARYVSLYSPKGVEYKDKFDTYIIDRGRYDKWLVSKAIEAGGDIWIGSTVYKLEKTSRGYRVLGRGRSGLFEVEANVVVIAAGASSKLIEMVGLERESDEHNLGQVVQYVMAGVEADEDKIEMYSGRRYCPGAYAWIIPRGEGYANVGLGIRKPYVRKEDRDLPIIEFLHRFIYEHPVASKKLRMGKAISVIGGVVPVGPPLKTVGDNALLVGDSANQVISSLGAGVPTSVVAGSIAGETIAEYLSGDAELSEYEKRWRREIGDAIDNGYQLRLMIDALCRSDTLMEQGLKIFGQEHMSDFVRTKVPAGSRFLAWMEKIARTL